MNWDVLIVALLAGAANWAFRYLPIRFGLSAGTGDGAMARFLAATGPAAICTLFVASVLPAVMSLPQDGVALVAGLLAVCVVYAMTRSVAGATFAGALGHGLAFWALSGAPIA